jgi:uncharacterized protein
LTTLDHSAKRLLLEMARRSIAMSVRGGPGAGDEELAPSAAVQEPAAAFVTLHELGQLRGCIGMLRYEVPLWHNVVEAASSAALEDPRFEAVTEDELDKLEIEISVLEPPFALTDAREFQVGRHGVIVERGMRRALLLPQVAAEMGWDAGQMLEAVCRKAELHGDAWRDPGTRLFAFEATCFDAVSLDIEAGEGSLLRIRPRRVGD